MRSWLPGLVLSTMLLGSTAATQEPSDRFESDALLGEWESTPLDGVNDRQITRLAITRVTDGSLVVTMRTAASWRERVGLENRVRYARTSPPKIALRLGAGRTVGFDVIPAIGEGTAFHGSVSPDGTTLEGTWTRDFGHSWRETFHLIPGTAAGPRERRPDVAAGLPYTASTQTLSFYSADRIDDGSGIARAGCVGLQASGAGGPVRMDVTLERDGDDWIVRPAAPADGTLTMRLRHAEGNPVSGIFAGAGSRRVIGWVSGTATNTSPATPFDDPRRKVSLHASPGPPVIEGSVASGFISDGVVQTEATFIGRDGVSFVCQAGTVFWWMTRAVA